MFSWAASWGLQSAITLFRDALLQDREGLEQVTTERRVSPVQAAALFTKQVCSICSAMEVAPSLADGAPGTENCVQAVPAEAVAYMLPVSRKMKTEIPVKSLQRLRKGNPD